MIIGICGFQSSGKDSIASFLVNKYGFKQLSFASALKDIISIIFNWSRNKLDGLTLEDRLWREEIDVYWAKTYNIPYLTPRYVLQYFATDLFRKHFHEDIWVNIIGTTLNKYKNIVISDCRFINEINMIIKNGGQILHVHRNLPEWFNIYKNGEYVEQINNIHCSETQWIRCNFNYEINNYGTIDELNEKISLLMSEILE
jgi:hypothetical protein